MFSASFFATQKNTYQPMFLQNAEMPPCVTDINSLPISMLTSTSYDGAEYRGSAFMVDPNIWVTAAHVVDGNVNEVSLYLHGNTIKGTIEFINDNGADIAVIIADTIDGYEPLIISEHDPMFYEEMWNIGYPGWAGQEQVVTSGHLIDLIDDSLVATTALVMGGMSGGPTVHCNGDQLQVDGVIRSYRKQLTSEEVVIIDGIHTIEKSYINTGEGYSTSLHRVF